MRVEDLVARALANAPSVGARRARLEAAVAALAAADAPPDPRAEFEIRDAGFPRWTLGSDVMSMIGVSVTQELTGAARRTARHAFAEAEIEERRAETDSTACDLTAAVRTSFARLYAVDQERAIIDSAREVAHLLVETASARYASGESDQAAVLRAQLEQTRLGERMADLRTERAVVVATLNRLTNSPAESPIGAVQALPDPLPLPSPLADLPNLAGDVAAEVLERRAAVEAASQRVDLARADLTPTYSVGGGVDWQGGVDRIVSVTLGVTWPARKSRKQLPAIAASVQDLQAAREDLADMAAEARAEAVRLVAEIRQAEDQITRYRSGLLPQSRAAFDATRVSYLSGRGDFAAVLDEFRQWTDLRTELVRREASRFAAWGRLEVLVNPSSHAEWHKTAAHDSTKKEPNP